MSNTNDQVDTYREQLQSALRVVVHDSEVACDGITRYYAEDNGVDVYVVRDPEWCKRLRRLTELAFPSARAAMRPSAPKTGSVQ